MISDLLADLQAEWRLHAACDGTDLDLWFNPERADEALTYCGQCPVRDDCLESALKNREADGVAGGTIPEQRRRLAKKRGAKTWPYPTLAYEYLQENCSVEWCREKRYCKGMCAKHYDRVRVHGTPTLPPKPDDSLDRDDAVWTVRRVAAAHGVSEGAVMSGSMVRDVVAARHEVMVELVAKGWSLNATGRFLGKHHTSVLNAVRKVAA